jgi:hypothetical protein
VKGIVKGVNREVGPGGKARRLTGSRHVIGRGEYIGGKSKRLIINRRTKDGILIERYCGTVKTK